MTRRFSASALMALLPFCPVSAEVPGENSGVVVAPSVDEQPLVSPERDLFVDVEQRKAELDILDRRLRKLLSPEAISKISHREADLGLTYSQPLSRDMPVRELAHRLGVIEAFDMGQRN